MNTYDSAVEAARYDIFKYIGDLDIRPLHPTRDALVLHTHRAAYISFHKLIRQHTFRFTHSQGSIHFRVDLGNVPECH